MKRDWIVAQIGAREHYAVARALQQNEQLERLYTEFWSGDSLLSNRARQSARLGPLNALFNRHHAHIPDDKVTAFNLPTLGTAALDLVTARLGRERSIEADYGEHLRIGKKFARRCISDLSKREISAENHAFFGYNTGCLETLRWLNRRGVATVVGQIDPGRVEEDLVRAESQKWPGWATDTGHIPAAFYARLQAEWDAASKVLVNSDWSRDALIKQGVDAAKIVVVPLAYEAPPLPPNSPARAANEPLEVLWLGSVLLRKGIQYLLEAAILLQKTRIRFVVAGPIYINEDKIANAPANVEFIGRVERSRASELYRQADVFALPTLSDGFAITQLEAMAHGLPVVTTARCGAVVTPDIDGTIVPAGDAQALAQALLSLDENREKLRAMKVAAREKSRQFSLQRFADGLNAALAD